MSVTRKDFEAIARGFAESRPGPRDPDKVKTQWLTDRFFVAEALQYSNPNFIRSRFFEATERDLYQSGPIDPREDA